MGLVFLIPVSVYRQDLARRLVNADDVGRGAVRVVLDVNVGVNLEDRPKAVLVVRGLAAPLNLVVGHVHDGTLRLHARCAHVDLAIHARPNAGVEVQSREVLHMSAALGAVEIGGGEGQQQVVDGDKEELGAVLLLVPCDLEVLRAAQRHLRQKLLKLCAELGALGGELPVHVGGLALGLGDLVRC